MAIFHMFHTNYESEQMSNWFWGCRTMPDNSGRIFWFQCNAMNIYSGFAFHDFFWYDFTLPCDSSLGRYINLLLFLSCPMVLKRMKSGVSLGVSFGRPIHRIPHKNPSTKNCICKAHMQAAEERDRQMQRLFPS